MEADRDVELLSELPIRLEPRIGGGDPHVLWRKFTEGFDAARPDLLAKKCDVGKLRCIVETLAARARPRSTATLAREYERWKITFRIRFRRPCAQIGSDAGEEDITHV
jgi:hypothetical protein